jgi:hypothetical protein
MKRQLLLGAGRHHDKRMGVDGDDQWGELTTLDSDPATGADVIHDLDDLPYLHFTDNQFDEVHAYETLEHCGSQGDWKFFFAQFGELWRILKADGLLFATVPSASSPWAWADPGHRRIITANTLQFLSRAWYAEALAKTMASDYRAALVGDWAPMGAHDDGEQLKFILRALK